MGFNSGFKGLIFGPFTPFYIIIDRNIIVLLGKLK